MILVFKTVNLFKALAAVGGEGLVLAASPNTAATNALFQQ